MVGITYAAEFAVNVCRDSGYGAIAGQIENFAKMSILVVSLPVLMAVIAAINGSDAVTWGEVEKPVFSPCLFV